MCHQLTLYWNLFQSFFSKDLQISHTTAVFINKTQTLKSQILNVIGQVGLKTKFLY